MYGLNAVALVFFGCINVLACQLCKWRERLRRRILFSLCAALLAGNLLRYGVVYPLIQGVVVLPVEFSTVAYFAVPVILLTARKELHSWAAYSGLMAGFFYYMTMIVAGGVLYGSNPPLAVYLSLLCHGTVYLCGFVVIGTEICSAGDAPKLALGVALVAVRAAVLRPFADSSRRYLIYMLLDAAVVRQLLPQSVWPAALLVYYLSAAGLVLLTIRGFFRENRKQYRRFSAV